MCLARQQQQQQQLLIVVFACSLSLSLSFPFTHTHTHTNPVRSIAQQRKGMVVGFFLPRFLCCFCSLNGTDGTTRLLRRNFLVRGSIPRAQIPLHSRNSTHTYRSRGRYHLLSYDGTKFRWASVLQLDVECLLLVEQCPKAA